MPGPHPPGRARRRPLDNAVAESFFATLPTELLDRHRWATRHQLAQAIFKWIEVFYNRQCRHSTLGTLPPSPIPALPQLVGDQPHGSRGHCRTTFAARRRGHDLDDTRERSVGAGSVDPPTARSRRSPRPLAWGFVRFSWLGGEDSNPQ